MTAATLITAAVELAAAAGVVFGHLIIVALDAKDRRRARSAWEKAWRLPAK